MVILTAANVGEGAQEWRKYKQFSYKGVIQESIAKAESLGYKTLVYDLGNLGFGEPYNVDNENFMTQGYFTKIRENYYSKSLFKPDIVQRCLEKYEDFTAYLDGDALLNDSIDEVVSDEFDVGVTLRRVSEIENEWHRENMDIVKFSNAGVIFFNPTRTTFRFIGQWRELTQKVNNDQMALNQLVCPEKRPEENSIHVINGVRIKYFPGDQYNFYYFDENWVPNIKIYHFKGTVRGFYPFDWKKRLYCRAIMPGLNRVKAILKKSSLKTARDK